MANLTKEQMIETENTQPTLQVLETVDHPLEWLEIWNVQACNGYLRDELEKAFPSFKN